TQLSPLSLHDALPISIVARELALIKVASTPQLHNEIQGLITPFRADILDVSRDSLTIQVTGKPDKIEALIALLRPYGIKEISKTGITALLRGQQPQSSQVADISQFSM